MLGFYAVVAIVLLCIAYAGPEETMRLFAYVDLQLRYALVRFCLLYTSPSPRDVEESRMPSSA